MGSAAAGFGSAACAAFLASSASHSASSSCFDFLPFLPLAILKKYSKVEVKQGQIRSSQDNNNYLFGGAIRCVAVIGAGGPALCLSFMNVLTIALLSDPNDASAL